MAIPNNQPKHYTLIMRMMNEMRNARADKIADAQLYIKHEKGQGRQDG